MSVEYLIWSHQSVGDDDDPRDCYWDSDGEYYPTAQDAVDYILGQQQSRSRECEPWFESFEQAVEQAKEWSEIESIAHSVVSCEVDAGRVLSEDRTEIRTAAAIRDGLMEEAGFSTGDNMMRMVNAWICFDIGGLSIELSMNDERDVAIIRRLLPVLKEFAESGS